LVGGNCDYKATSVAIAIASLTELGNLENNVVFSKKTSNEYDE
jgi:hypothetical protein